MTKILLIVYDNESYTNHFPVGMAYIASALKQGSNNEVTIYNQDVYHYPEQHLYDYLNNNNFDIVAMGVIGGYWQYKKLIEISKTINRLDDNKRPIYIIGGHGPSPEPEYFLRKTNADFVVIGEGIVTIVELINKIKSYKLNKINTSIGSNAIKQLFDERNDFENINGIAFINKINGRFVKTSPRDLIKDVDTIPYPAYELFPMEHYVLAHVDPGFDKTDRIMPMLSGYGCPFKCNFCYKFYNEFRTRSVNDIIQEIKLLKKEYNVNAISFCDELLMSSVSRTTEICNAFLENNLNIKWSCQGRLNYAGDINLLKLMKLSGCIFINYGIESMDDQVLKNMHKALTVKQIIIGVENTIKAGIHPGLNIIFGNYGDNEKILRRDVNFLKKYGDGSQLRSIRYVTSYPGSELYYDAIKNGKLKDVADFYENKHFNSDLLSVNFTNLSDDKMYKLLKWANIKLIKDYYNKNKKNMIKQCIDLYDRKNIKFRGFRQL